jgi:group II intron reverse transcriptase/maturase
MLNVTEKMERLHKISKRSPMQIRKSLWKLLVKPEWLAQAWEEIRRNKGSQTAGVDNTTAIDVDLDLINKLAQQLKDGTYRPTPVRRVLIPKANGKTRPLGIPTIKDRIVQQALKMLLEPIFEADFFNCSHGFRQGMSTITALRDVARAYPSTSWVIEGDIKGCFDNIPHGKLLQLIGKCIADEKVLNLIRRFLKAGYMEDWKYHKTFSGTPQGGVLSPLLANIFLHQLDDFMMKELEANQTQTVRESNSRRNPEYRKISNRITLLRRKLKEGNGGREIIKEIKELERQQKNTPYYAKDKKRLGKVWYVRYADDFVIFVAGNKIETEVIKDKVKNKLTDIGLELSEEKTKLTHWSKSIRFLGYQIQGKQRARGVGIRAILSIPNEKVRNATENLGKIGSYYHIPEVDVMTQLNAIYRGWCNYYRYANSPQSDFSRLAGKTWWVYAHFNARKQKSSIKAMIVRAKKAGRLSTVKKGKRVSHTFQLPVGKKTLFLDIFPPKTEQIRKVTNRQNWTVDLKPVAPLNWQSGRSLATRLEAIERANGVCERCNENPVAQVHHTIPIRGKSFLARVMSDRDQRYTARALCKECHLEVHKGSFKPNRQKSNVNAGCRESGLSGVGSAVEKPTNES